MDEMSLDNDSDAETMSTDMLEGIRGGSQYNPIINRRKAFYKILDRIKRGQAEC